MKHNRGSATIMVMIVAMVFSIMLGGLVLFGTTQFNATIRGSAHKKALMLAEAGIQYYRWHLAHDPDDFQDGTGAPGPYIHNYSDPQGGVEGTFALSITEPGAGSTIVEIISTGQDDASGVKRTIKTLFGKPSLAEYAYLHNSNAWFGTGTTVNGKVMSNGGIRQDGVNTSTIQSAKETYTCGSETGCSPSETKSGIWGSGGPDNLWEYPVSPVDFDGISVDFSEIKTAAQNEGTYFGPSGNQGYHFEFKDDGTVDVFRVNNTGWRRGYSDEEGCERLYERISNESLVGNYSLASKHIFFAEDTVWVNGIVSGRATVVAARFPLDTNETDIWIHDNLVYDAKDGTNALGVISEDDIFFALDLPQILEVDAALLAQGGRVFRHHYSTSGCGNYGNAVRDQLVIYGSVISNQKAAWNWGSGPSSGFTERNITYDSNFYLAPPPYFPTGDVYEFLSWEEVSNP
ncbi:hypothetical protein ACFL1M_01675 [Patescibacteria group bacterium]